MSSRFQSLLAVLNTTAIVGMLFALVGHQRASEQELAELRAQVDKATAGAGTDQAQRRAAAEAAMRLWANTPGARPPSGQAQAASPMGQAPTAQVSEPGDEADSAHAPPPSTSFEESRTRVFTAFDQEPVDGDWSAQASKVLNDAFRNHLPATSHVKSLDCKATLCRVELVHRDATTQGTLLRSGMRTWPGSIFVASEVQQGPDYVVTLIAAKEGTNPPL
ncbi:hypothetical protein JYJ95_23950 [Corallococcus exiguus]|uniref:hypothetical protein n=1 Tax=Corallococcus exiguus TaxID=83462 RepID=UPI001A8FD991|nr:hypothetical protein [Corallococcus exiguus]MBN8469568.1 hypothetical protein [Corallococcus exiguus]